MISKKAERHHQNIGKSSPIEKKKPSSKVGPIVLGILMFVVVGSSLLQIIQNARTAYSTAYDD